MLNHKSHPRLEQVHARTAATNGGSWQASNNGAGSLPTLQQRLTKPTGLKWLVQRTQLFQWRVKLTQDAIPQRTHDDKSAFAKTDTLFPYSLLLRVDAVWTVLFYSTPCLHPGIGHAPLSQPTPLTTARFLSAREVWLTDGEAGPLRRAYYAYAGCVDVYFIYTAAIYKRWDIIHPHGEPVSALGAARNKHSTRR